MSFLEPHAGVFRPEDFSTVQTVYDRMLNEPWIPKTPSTREQCARIVLTVYERRKCPPAALYDLCLEAAKDRLSLDKPQLAGQSQTN